MTLIKTTTHSYPLTIFVAGGVDEAILLCREFCDVVGWCVTVTPTTYIYKGGSEPGLAVGIINYAKYPQHPSDLWDRAEHLAEYLVAFLNQHSCSIQGPTETVHYEWGDDLINVSWRIKSFVGPDHSLSREGGTDGLVTFYCGGVE